MEELFNLFKLFKKNFYFLILFLEKLLQFYFFCIIIVAKWVEVEHCD